MRQIDADELKKALWEEYENECENIPYMDNDGRMDLDIVDDIIDDAPTLAEWIPVNEAMPPIDKGASDIVLITYQYPNEKEKLAMAFYSTKHLNSLADGEWCTSHGYGLPATAWMPLPNAYKGEEENE